MNIFVSVGTTSGPTQEAFVKAIEDRMKVEGLIPQTVGRTYFTADSPFIGVNNLMDECNGAVVIALERIYVDSGMEKRGATTQVALSAIKLATPWNQIEAALAYSKKIPLLVIVEEGVRQDGLLERGHDWYVISAPVDPSFLSTAEFNGVLAAWKKKLSTGVGRRVVPAVGEMTIGQLLSDLKPSHLWGIMGSTAAVIGGAFTLGAKFFP